MQAQTDAGQASSQAQRKRGRDVKKTRQNETKRNQTRRRDLAQRKEAAPVLISLRQHRQTLRGAAAAAATGCALLQSER